MLTLDVHANRSFITGLFSIYFTVFKCIPGTGMTKTKRLSGIARINMFLALYYHPTSPYPLTTLQVSSNLTKGRGMCYCKQHLF